MPSVYVDVDLDEFETDDLIAELESRFERKRIMNKDLKALKTLARKTLGANILDVAIGHNLLRTLKAECYLEHADKFTLLELQERLSK